MKVEMVVPGLATAGMETVVAGLSRGLAARGHDVGVTCIEYVGAIGESLQADGFRVAIVPAPGVWTNVYARSLVRWFAERRPVVVHTHSGAWLKAARAATRVGIGVVVHTFHGLLETERDPWYETPLHRWAAWHTRTVVAVSESLRRYLVEKIGIDAAKVCVLANGVDAARFGPGRGSGVVRERFGLGPDRWIVGHVGRFSAVKNHALLVDAFARFHDRRPDAFLALVGDGPLRPGIEERAAAAGLSGHVGFLGEVADVAPTYRDFDAFVLPSLAEGTSISLLEAMATGLPIVATSVGGTPDLVADTGVLIGPGDAVALSDALEGLWRDRGLASRLGASARDRVVRQYSEAAVLDRYEALYAGCGAAS